MNISEESTWELELDLMGKASSEIQKGNYETAFESLNEVLSVNPMKWEAYKWRGLLYAGSGNYQKAIEDFNRAINIILNDSNVNDSVTMEIYYDLGKVFESIYFSNEFLESIEYLSQAITIYDKILQEYPKCIPPRYRRGGIFYYVGMKADDGEELLRRAVEDFDFILENEPKNMDTTMKEDAILKRNLARTLLGGDISWLQNDVDA
ncbi:tetratricopeptide repeat protein [Microcoleus sp. herbarium12]|uniref:tetratricopeptide repeat protein n=1 Tax=Microcoleus sp. herbarium12 TaxID=3055437 RepID=UPI002FD47098